jgi:hypothetical protein
MAHVDLPRTSSCAQQLGVVNGENMGKAHLENGLIISYGSLRRILLAWKFSLSVVISVEAYCSYIISYMHAVDTRREEKCSEDFLAKYCAERIEPIFLPVKLLLLVLVK